MRNDFFYSISELTAEELSHHFGINDPSVFENVTDRVSLTFYNGNLVIRIDNNDVQGHKNTLTRIFKNAKSIQFVYFINNVDVLANNIEISHCIFFKRLKFENASSNVSVNDCDILRMGDSDARIIFTTCRLMTKDQIKNLKKIYPLAIQYGKVSAYITTLPSHSEFYGCFLTLAIIYPRNASKYVGTELKDCSINVEKASEFVISDSTISTCETNITSIPENEIFKNTKFSFGKLSVDLSRIVNTVKWEFESYTDDFIKSKNAGLGNADLHNTTIILPTIVNYIEVKRYKGNLPDNYLKNLVDLYFNLPDTSFVTQRMSNGTRAKIIAPKYEPLMRNAGVLDIATVNLMIRFGKFINIDITDKIDQYIIAQKKGK